MKPRAAPSGSVNPSWESFFVGVNSLDQSVSKVIAVPQKEIVLVGPKLVR